MTEMRWCHWCGSVLDPQAVLWRLALDPVTGSETVRTACSSEHLHTPLDGAATHTDSD
ncbi:hypothetical protein [Haloactinomyces albus]|uniref:Uncharacterized protein n=1 Tax=Haloactinomyces albus TaxID=1352928 RepID=A0AAE3ZGY3_9ACTN|nr:hypothetical protein [Haloactinomyces albus]MDR7303379.1 hypothetical protein [Haloactinomyces albus]